MASDGDTETIAAEAPVFQYDIGQASEWIQNEKKNTATILGAVCKKVKGRINPGFCRGIDLLHSGVTVAFTPDGVDPSGIFAYPVFPFGHSWQLMSGSNTAVFGWNSLSTFCGKQRIEEATLPYSATIPAKMTDLLINDRLKLGLSNEEIERVLRVLVRAHALMLYAGLNGLMLLEPCEKWDIDFTIVKKIEAGLGYQHLQ
jgi:hypothetical protein